MSGVVIQTILVPQPLKDRKIVTMPLERRKAVGQRISNTRIVGGRIPSIFGDSPAKAHKDHSLRVGLGGKHRALGK